MDPFYLHHIATANAEVASALENLASDDPAYDDKHSALVAVANLLEAMILREATN